MLIFLIYFMIITPFIEYMKSFATIFIIEKDQTRSIQKLKYGGGIDNNV